MANPFQLSPVDKTHFHLPFNANAMLTSTAFLLVFAVAICLAMAPGNWPEGIALMAAFP